MDENSAPLPDYFILNEPGHFRVRPDLLEELCVENAMELTLPKTGRCYIQWLRISGYTAEAYPFSKLQEETANPYRLTNRVVLQTAVLPGHTNRSNLITDGHRWSALCEQGGLFEFVMLRAVEFAAWRSFSRKDAWNYLHAASGKNNEHLRRLADWSLGYDRTTSICTILAGHNRVIEEKYLSGH